MVTTNSGFSYRQQDFSLSYSIVSRISTQCSADIYEKLIQTCKYFVRGENRLILNGTIDSANSNCNIWRLNEKDNFHLENFRNKRLWLNKDFSIGPNCRSNDFITLMAPYIYRCDIVALSLWRQHLSYDDFLVLTGTSTLKDVSLQTTLICYDVESPFTSIVPFEDIMAKLPKIYSLEWKLGAIVTPQTVGKLRLLPHFENLKKLSIYPIAIYEVKRDFDNFSKRYNNPYISYFER